MNQLLGSAYSHNAAIVSKHRHFYQHRLTTDFGFGQGRARLAKLVIPVSSGPKTDKKLADLPYVDGLSRKAKLPLTYAYTFKSDPFDWGKDSADILMLYGIEAVYRAGKLRLYLTCEDMGITPAAQGRLKDINVTYDSLKDLPPKSVPLTTETDGNQFFTVESVDEDDTKPLTLDVEFKMKVLHDLWQRGWIVLHSQDEYSGFGLEATEVERLRFHGCKIITHFGLIGTDWDEHVARCQEECTHKFRNAVLEHQASAYWGNFVLYCDKCKTKITLASFSPHSPGTVDSGLSLIPRTLLCESCKEETNADEDGKTSTLHIIDRTNDSVQEKKRKTEENLAKMLMTHSKEKLSMPKAIETMNNLLEHVTTSVTICDLLGNLLTAQRDSLKRKNEEEVTLDDYQTHAIMQTVGNVLATGKRLATISNMQDDIIRDVQRVCMPLLEANSKEDTETPDRKKPRLSKANTDYTQSLVEDEDTSAMQKQAFK